jgi:hypothetical protein
MMMALCPAGEARTLTQGLSGKCYKSARIVRDPALSPDFDFFVSGDFDGAI